VSRLGRNDPCHCGSGKKYKKCHQSIDEDRVREEKSLATLAQWVAYHGRTLRESARREAEASAPIQAAMAAWPAADAEPFADALFEQHALFDLALEAGCAVHTVALPEGPAPERRAKLQACLAESHVSLQEVVEVKRGRGLRLKDALLGTESWVADPETAEKLEPMEVVLGRVIKFEDRPVLLNGWEKIGFRGRKTAMSELAAQLEEDLGADAEAADRVIWLRREAPRVIARGRASAVPTRP
jgi:hypothetical protein